MSDLISRLRSGVDVTLTWCEAVALSNQQRSEAADRIAELEVSLADAVEAQQIIGLKLAHAEAESARLRVDAGRWRYREKLLNEGGQIWQTKGAVTIRDFKRDIIARGHSEAEAIDAAMQGHSSTALCGPTADAAPSCERNQVIKECAAVCAKFVRQWNETSLDRYNAGRTQDSLLWDGKAMGASLCHDTIMGLVANRSNEDTRTTGESDS